MRREYINNMVPHSIMHEKQVLCMYMIMCIRIDCILYIYMFIPVRCDEPEPVPEGHSEGSYICIIHI